MSDEACTTCGREPAPGNVVRLVGRDGLGNIAKLCSKCWCDQNAPKQPAEIQLPLNKKRTKKK